MENVEDGEAPKCWLIWISDRSGFESRQLTFGVLSLSYAGYGIQFSCDGRNQAREVRCYQIELEARGLAALSSTCRPLASVVMG